ncbi:unnamed protein product [Choristocarpus tenellus]
MSKGGYKMVALVGSSGGGAATMGQFDALALLGLVRSELDAAGIKLAAVQFVSAALPLDTASAEMMASLWEMDVNGDFIRTAQGKLEDVNKIALRKDEKIEALLRSTTGDVSPLPTHPLDDCGDSVEPLPRLDGLVAISFDVHGVNRRAVEAARDMGLPVVGTGGSSLGEAIAMGCNVVGSSGGSVATTNKSKAVSYATGLCGYWGLAYCPGTALTGVLLAPTSFFGACLPAFLTVMVTTRVAALLSSLAIAASTALQEWWGKRLTEVMPVVMGAVSARQMSALGDMAAVAGELSRGCALERSVVEHV